MGPNDCWAAKERSRKERGCGWEERGDGRREEGRGKKGGSEEGDVSGSREVLRRAGSLDEGGESRGG